MIDEAWIPLVYELANPPDKAQMAGPVLANVDDTDFQIIYRLPIPLMKGNLRLHIDGVRLGVYSADPGNHVVKFNISGVSFQDVDVLSKMLEPVNQKMMKTHMFPAIDVSKWESLLFRVWCSVSMPKQLSLTSAAVHCYYA